MYLGTLYMILTKFGLIPSIILIVDIPEEITGSGKVYVSLKDSIFESLSPYGMPVNYTVFYG